MKIFSTDKYIIEIIWIYICIRTHRAEAEVRFGPVMDPLGSRALIDCSRNEGRLMSDVAGAADVDVSERSSCPPGEMLAIYVRRKGGPSPRVNAQKGKFSPRHAFTDKGYFSTCTGPSCT